MTRRSIRVQIDLDVLRKQYNAGKTIAELALLYNVNGSTIARRLKDDPNFILRKPGSKRITEYNAPLVETLIKEHKENGLSIKDIGVKYGYRAESIRRIYHRAGYDFKEDKIRRYWSIKENY